MHQMQTIVTDDPAWCPSVSFSVCRRDSTLLRCAKTAEQIKMLLDVNTVGGRGTLR